MNCKQKSLVFILSFNVLCVRRELNPYLLEPQSSALPIKLLTPLWEQASNLCSWDQNPVSCQLDDPTI